nr:MAG TPA: hypothetical protein [Bacteriophage sp.]
MIKEMVLRVGLEPTCDHYRFYCIIHLNIL